MSSRSLRILDTNTAASKLTGYSHKELLGMRLADLVPEESRVKATSQAASATAGVAPRTSSPWNLRISPTAPKSGT